MLCTACVSSLESWVPEAIVKQDPRLKGCWVDGDDLWVFSSMNGTKEAPDAKTTAPLRLVFTEDGTSASFTIKTFSLGEDSEEGWRFFDLEPVQDDKGNSLKTMHTLTTHGLLRYRFQAENLLLSTLDGETFESRLALDDAPLFNRLEDRILLKDTSEKLFAFLQVIQEEDSLFTEQDTLYRCDQ